MAKLIEEFKTVGHLRRAFDKKRLPQIIEDLEKIISDNELDFDAIVFRGISGALIAPILSYKLDKHLIVVRKSGEHAHSNHRTEGYAGTKRYIIVDDLIDSGGTMATILEHMSEFNSDAKCVGIMLYEDSYCEYPKSHYEKIPVFKR